MSEIRLGAVEARFADLVWQNAPITTLELVKICKTELEWARTTTYTVLKKLCEKGLFQTENSLVTILTAFSSRKTPSETDLKTIREWLESYEEGKK